MNSLTSYFIIALLSTFSLSVFAEAKTSTHGDKSVYTTPGGFDASMPDIDWYAIDKDSKVSYSVVKGEDGERLGQLELEISGNWDVNSDGSPDVSSGYLGSPNYPMDIKFSVDEDGNTDVEKFHLGWLRNKQGVSFGSNGFSADFATIKYDNQDGNQVGSVGKSKLISIGGLQYYGELPTGDSIALTIGAKGELFAGGKVEISGQDETSDFGGHNYGISIGMRVGKTNLEWFTDSTDFNAGNAELNHTGVKLTTRFDAKKSAFVIQWTLDEVDDGNVSDERTYVKGDWLFN